MDTIKENLLWSMSVMTIMAGVLIASLWNTPMPTPLKIVTSFLTLVAWAFCFACNGDAVKNLEGNRR